MSFIRTRKIDWNKFFTAMVAFDPYGLTYVCPEAIIALQTPANELVDSRA